MLLVRRRRCMLIYSVDSRFLVIAPAQSSYQQSFPATRLFRITSCFCFVILLCPLNSIYKIVKYINGKSLAWICREFGARERFVVREIQTEEVTSATPFHSETPILTEDVHVTVRWLTARHGSNSVNCVYFVMENCIIGYRVMSTLFKKLLFALNGTLACYKGFGWLLFKDSRARKSVAILEC